MPLTIKLLLMLPMLSNSVKLVLNVRLLLLIKLELRSSSWRKCGKVPMVPSEIYSMVLFSVSLLSSRIFLDWFQAGKNQSSLDVMLSEINTKPQISSWISQANFRFCSKAMMERNKKWKSIITKELAVSVWECITLMKVSTALLTAASNLHFKDNILCIWLLRIQFWRSMMVDSRTSSKKYTKKNIKKISKLRRSGMSTDLSMIWLHIWSNPKEGMSGHAKIMMVMFNLTASLKVIHYFKFRLRISWINDISSNRSWWISRSRGCSWNSNKTLQNASKRSINFN